MIRLKVMLPTRVLVEEEAASVTAEGENGSFSLLPRHIDFVSALVPSILSFRDGEGKEVFLAVDEGVLVKCGSEVWVSVRDGVRGPDLGGLRRTVEERFRALDDLERKSRQAVSRMEADFVRRFLELGENG